MRKRSQWLALNDTRAAHKAKRKLDKRRRRQRHKLELPENHASQERMCRFRRLGW